MCRCHHATQHLMFCGCQGENNKVRDPVEISVLPEGICTLGRLFPGGARLDILCPAPGIMMTSVLRRFEGPRARGRRGLRGWRQTRPQWSQQSAVRSLRRGVDAVRLLGGAKRRRSRRLHGTEGQHSTGLILDSPNDRLGQSGTLRSEVRSVLRRAPRTRLTTNKPLESRPPQKGTCHDCRHLFFSRPKRHCSHGKRQQPKLLPPSLCHGV